MTDAVNGLFKIILACSVILESNFPTLGCNPPLAPNKTTLQKQLEICDGSSTQLSAKGTGTIGWYSSASGGQYLSGDSLFTTPILTQTTTFYVQDSTCAASNSRLAITVMVHPKVKADFYVKDFCVSDSAQFQNLSKNAQSFYWKFGDAKTSSKRSPKHFYDLEGTVCWPSNVTLVAIDSNGCSDSICKPIVINANPVSDFTYTINNHVVHFKPKQVGNAVYKWVFEQTDSSLVFNATYTFAQLGSKMVCLNVTNAAGCFSKTCKEIFLQADIKIFSNSPSLKIYPNPNTGNFTIEKIQNKETICIEIFNSLGQSTHLAYLNELVNELNINLAYGIYFLKAVSGEVISYQKIVIRK